MFQQILVPLDGSTRSERALPIAAQIAHASNSSITLLYVVTPPIHHDLITSEPYALAQHAWENERECRFAEARHYLTSVATYACLEGIGVRGIIEMGAPGSVILEQEDNLHADLIVMCSHGRTGFTRWVLGSVALKVARLSTVPVLILRESSVHAEQPTQVLVALDGTAEGEEALLPAAQLSAVLAAPAPGRLHLVSVAHLPPVNIQHTERAALERDQAMQHIHNYLRAVQQRFDSGAMADLKLEVTSSVIVDSNIADTLVHFGETGNEAEGIEGCSIIAMATHTPDSLLQRIMGSITEQVLDSSRLPMLIVHPRLSEHVVTEAHTFHASSPEATAHA